MISAPTRALLLWIAAASLATGLSIGGCPPSAEDTGTTTGDTTTDGSTSSDVVPIRPPRPGSTNTGNTGGTGNDSTGGGGNTDDGGSTSDGPALFGDDHVLAVGDPKLTVIVYDDFQCPNCGRFERDTFPTIKTNYIDTGKVRWVTRHLPIPQIHPFAQGAAEAAECAAKQGKFDEYKAILFENQDALTTTDLKSYAQQLGLNGLEFGACVDTHETQERVNRDAELARDQGVPGTPGFFIGADLVTGFKTVEQMSALLDAALASLN